MSVNSSHQLAPIETVANRVPNPESFVPCTTCVAIVSMPFLFLGAHIHSTGNPK